MSRDEHSGIFVAVGSNLGDRSAHLDHAVAAIDQHERISVIARSAWIETDPIDCPPDASRFLNGVIEVSTDLSARELLAVLLATETNAGRTRGPVNSSRTLDLDLLLFHDERIESVDLTIPHPRMWGRPFVLGPMRDVCGEDRFRTIMRRWRPDAV